MILRIITAVSLFLFAVIILATSIFRTAQIKYDFKSPPSPEPQNYSNNANVDYNLPPANYINPSHPLWFFKATKDKLWLKLTTNPLKKAQISLYLADNRLVFALEYFEDKDMDDAVALSSRSEKYLNQSYELAIKAQSKGMKVDEFMYELSLSSLKHRQVLENFLVHSPEDAAPVIVKNMDTSKMIYQKTSQYLISVGKNAPNNPFDR
jgi:hypothetical protein